MAPIQVSQYRNKITLQAKIASLPRFSKHNFVRVAITLQWSLFAMVNLSRVLGTHTMCFSYKKDLRLHRKIVSSSDKTSLG